MKTVADIKAERQAIIDFYVMIDGPNPSPLSKAELERRLQEFDEQNSPKNEYINEQRALQLSLLRLRYARRLTQAELAGRIGTTQSAISRLESLRGNPSATTLLKIAHALQADLLFYKK